MEAKSLMNPNSIMFEADSTLDKGTIYPFIETCIVANQKSKMFAELHFGHYIEAIMLVVQQHKLGEPKGFSLLSTTYGNLQKAKAIVEKSILNN
jgi:hypothetical protein